MRIIAKKRLREYWQSIPAAQSNLKRWYKIAEAAEWRSLMDVRETFPHADAATVKSGKTVTVFNIAGGDYRLITAIHYNASKVFVFFVLDHEEYDREQWKDQL